MSKPSTTYFCHNGHLLEDNPTRTLGEYDFLEDGEYPPCPVCQSLDVVLILDWHEGHSGVPYKPIRREDMERTDHKGNKYFQLLNVYDVSTKIRSSAWKVLKKLVYCLYNETQCINTLDNTTHFECVVPNNLLDEAKTIIDWDLPGITDGD